ncbi:Hypothetical protein A7982_02402 [Minicystis rosea]|nr:Hypothetical protein A7982_02402 [Minicystis rosea]
MTIDITRPQIGRIYDYVLGGTYNHEADRRAAESMLELMPAYPRWAYQNRAFLADVGRRWAAEGRPRVLDLGSGLPTQGHFNEHMPDAKILFTDVDPLTVVQAQHILAYNSEMAYLQADLQNAEAVIEQATGFFGDERVLAVGCIGVVYFLSDDNLRRLMAALYDFCAPGSVIALSWPTVPDNDVVRATFTAAAAHARVQFYARTPEQVTELMKPWRSVGIESLSERYRDAGPPAAHPDHPLHQTEMFGAFGAR